MKFLIPLGIALLMFPATAQAELTDTFNMAELTRSYALSCEGQAAMRHNNIPPPHFPKRPPEFNNDSEALALYSPHLTEQQRKTAQQLFESVPKYALPVIWRGGGVYVFTRRGIVEAVPVLAVERGWFADYGLYLIHERRLYVPFEKGEGLKRRRTDGLYVARRWVPTGRDQLRVVNHETGHIIDAMLGQYSLNSEGADGHLRLSNRPDYRAATKSDLARLASKQRPMSKERRIKLGYYMPYRFEGIRLGIQDEQRSRREVFAELWAEAHGYGKAKLNEAYPDTFKVVTSIVDFLKAQDAAAPVKCALGG